VNVIPIGRLKRLALHCLQGDLLSQKYITHREIALRRKAQMRHYIAGSIQLVNIHHLAAPDRAARLMRAGTTRVAAYSSKLLRKVPR
jgi:hypothetical protein